MSLGQESKPPIPIPDDKQQRDAVIKYLKLKFPDAKLEDEKLVWVSSSLETFVATMDATVMIRAFRHPELPDCEGIIQLTKQSTRETDTQTRGWNMEAFLLPPLSKQKERAMKYLREKEYEYKEDKTDSEEKRRAIAGLPEARFVFEPLKLKISSKTGNLTIEKPFGHPDADKILDGGLYFDLSQNMWPAATTFGWWEPEHRCHNLCSFWRTTLTRRETKDIAATAALGAATTAVISTPISVVYGLGALAGTGIPLGGGALSAFFASERYINKWRNPSLTPVVLSDERTKSYARQAYEGACSLASRLVARCSSSNAFAAVAEPLLDSVAVVSYNTDTDRTRTTPRPA